MSAIILVTPDIPQNTGNIIRLCANCGFKLILIKPLGWGNMDDKKLIRSGLDYHEFADIKIYDSWGEFIAQNTLDLVAIETCGVKYYHEERFSSNVGLVFGSETKGLSQQILNDIGIKNTLRIPMLPKQRSLNLSNSVAIVAYEVWRQLNFNGSI